MTGAWFNLFSQGLWQLPEKDLLWRCGDSLTVTATLTATTTTTMRTMTTTFFFSTCPDLYLGMWTILQSRYHQVSTLHLSHLRSTQDRSTLARIRRILCGIGTTWRLPYVPSWRSTPMTDWQLFSAETSMHLLPFFQKLVQLAKDRWWPDWNEDNVCRAGKPVSSLELKVLGALYSLANGATHFMVSRHTNISEEIHRLFSEVDSSHGIDMWWVYLHATGQCNVPASCRRVYSKGFSRLYWQCGSRSYWVGSMPHPVHLPVHRQGGLCLHRLWSHLHVQEIYSIHHCRAPRNEEWQAYCKDRRDCYWPVICNGWLNSKNWQCRGPDGETRTFRGVYLICDGGYHRWPCLISPTRTTCRAAPPCVGPLL